MTVALGRDRRTFLWPLLKSMVDAGWIVERIPDNGAIPHNQFRLVLRTDGADARFRLLIYKVSESGRARPAERRVELTSTYEGGQLVELPGFRDVVIGFSADEEVFVGIDPRRLKYGGPTHNASTFVSLDAVTEASQADALTVIPRPSALFHSEYQAYGQAHWLPTYLLEIDGVHTEGLTTGVKRARSGRSNRLEVANDAAQGEDIVLSFRSRAAPARRPRKLDVIAYEQGNEAHLARRPLSAEEFEAVRRRAEENGLLGEVWVLKAEKEQLVRQGRAHLVPLVLWTSRESVGAGYDVTSLEPDGTPRFIEVKATEGTIPNFYITRNEWATAEKLGQQYLIAVVTDVRGSPKCEYIRDPVHLEREGRLVRDPTRWRVTRP